MSEIIRISQLITILGSTIFFLAAIFSYNYQESSQGMLPIIHYPFRESSGHFLIISISLVILFILITVIHEIRKKEAFT
ncbi:MAG: hypothetical protein ACFFB5_23830 [Promethearchaeota archaeon]